MEQFLEECKLPGEKSPANAAFYRKQGNELFKAREFVKAIEFYNLSLCCSNPKSMEASMAFGNRSAAFFELKEPRECWKSIRLAREAGYLGNQTLDDREQRCLKLIASSEAGADPDDFFKLSHPANPKIPFITGCLELRRNEKFGRHIVTTADLKPGDIIAIETPFFKSLDANAITWRCTNCLKSSKMNLIPPEVGSSAMFCCIDCRDTATRVFYQTEIACGLRDFIFRIFSESLEICGGDYKMLEGFLDHPKLQATIFELDFSPESDPVILKLKQLFVFHSLQKGSLDAATEEFIEDHPALQFMDTDEQKTIAIRYFKQVYQILSLNSIGIDWNVPKKPQNDVLLNRIDIGAAVLLFGSYFNHSCDPNIDRVSVDDKILFFARRSVKAGEQLFISYGPYHTLNPKVARQDYINTKYGFKCNCVPCRFDPDDNTVDIDVWLKLIDAASSEVSSSTDAKTDFKQNCEMIQEFGESTGDLQLEKLMIKNSFLVSLIAKNEPYTFYRKA